MSSHLTRSADVGNFGIAVSLLAQDNGVLFIYLSLQYYINLAWEFFLDCFHYSDDMNCIT